MAATSCGAPVAYPSIRIGVHTPRLVQYTVFSAPPGLEKDHGVSVKGFALIVVAGYVFHDFNPFRGSALLHLTPPGKQGETATN